MRERDGDLSWIHSWSHSHSWDIWMKQLTAGIAGHRSSAVVWVFAGAWWQPYSHILEVAFVYRPSAASQRPEHRYFGGQCPRKTVDDDCGLIDDVHTMTAVSSVQPDGSVDGDIVMMGLLGLMEMMRMAAAEDAENLTHAGSDTGHHWRWYSSWTASGQRTS